VEDENTSQSNAELRVRLLEDVRRRLATGELDSDDAVLDTALAMLDGD
jgi:hypothetical protein